MQNLAILKINLENYRNFKIFEIETKPKPIIITGENGVGKTNILESISFLLPGKGLRSAKIEEICHHNCQEPWQTKFKLNSKIGISTIENKYNNSTRKKITEFNGAKIPNTDLSKLLNIIWLTPQMDGLFLGSPSDRRRFLDRIVYSFFSEQATQLNKYEHFVKERAQVLQQNRLEEDWLNILENKIADLAVKISAARVRVITKMQNAIDNLTNEFPKSLLVADGELEHKIRQNWATEHLIEFALQKLKQNRRHDQLSGRTNFGPHLSDLSVIHQQKNQAAENCSTGEQKALLISLIIAQINAQIAEYSLAPIVLLDEVFVHLDNRRKQYLTEFFLAQQMQVWITSTDLAGLKNLAKHAQIIKL